MHGFPGRGIDRADDLGLEGSGWLVGLGAQLFMRNLRFDLSFNVFGFIAGERDG